MTTSFDFRAVLLKIHDLLSDQDRARLHFLLGDDVPRYLRDDPSLVGTIRMFELLLDKAIISDEDCDYLIEAFYKIQCYDAAKRLKEYQRSRAQHGQRNFSIEDILLQFSDMPQDNSSAIVINDAVSSEQKDPLSSDGDAAVLKQWSTTLLPDSNKRTRNISKNQTFCRIFTGSCLSVLVLGLTILSAWQLVRRIRNPTAVSVSCSATASTTLASIESPSTAELTEGQRCRCHPWCQSQNQSFGICTHTKLCLCSMKELTKEEIGDRCTCDEWCRNRPNFMGGVCGDGNTCICQLSQTSYIEFPGIDRFLGDIEEHFCPNITVARAFASKLIDGPSKAGVYRSDTKTFWLKDLSQSNIKQPSVDSACTLFDYRHPGRILVESAGIDQYGGDIANYPCPGMALVRVLSYSLIDNRDKAAVYRHDHQLLWLKNLSDPSINKPSTDPHCTIFYFK